MAPKAPTPSSNALNQAAQATTQAAQAGGRRALAKPEQNATDVWTRSWDGAVNNLKNGDPGPAMAPLGLIPGVGLAAAGFQAGRSAVGVADGVFNQTWHSSSLSDVGTGFKQQAGSLGDAVANLFHAGDKPPPEGVLGHFGAFVAVLTNTEQLLSTLVSAIPFPALPAVRVLDLDVGLPHAHMHPPNLTPPNPVPVPLPSTGPVIPIPYVSGAATVLINGMPAARCGDMGAAVWCGGFFPMFEIFLGSSSVWLEGSRAARVGVDITKHCIFSNPKSIVKGGDSPIGPPIGFTVGSSPNVSIGGFPMPSLTAMALGAMFKVLFKAMAKLFGLIKGLMKKAFSRAAAEAGEHAPDATTVGGKWTGDAKPGAPPVGPNMAARYVRASQLIEEMLHNGKLRIGGDEAYQALVEAELRKVACSNTGEAVLRDIANSPHNVYIDPWRPGQTGNSASRVDDVAATTPGVGSDTRIYFNPDPNCGRYTPGSPPHTSAMHELGHARNNALGENARYNTVPGGFDKDRWSNMEEFNNINNVDNPHRREWGLPERTGHDSKP